MTRPATILALLVATAAAAADAPTGELIYRRKCAACHGPSGEGSKNYPHQLEGDRTAAQLAKYIAKSMPEDAPGTCTGAEAEAVAGYLYETFYSKEARERNKPPRVELSRLTVRQYRNALADLVGSFRTSATPDAKRGLRGEYFDARSFRNDKRVVDRIDPEVRFDFGTGAPADKIDSYQYSIRWTGSLLPAESGEYEFIVKCDHGVRLFVNDLQKPLIDAWVKSTADTEFKATLPLLGGRGYPVRLEFTKAKLGVDDSKDKKPKAKPVPASVVLLWKSPGRTAEAIPQRCLSPGKSPEVYVAATPFPPDDRSLGWERATTISKAWDQATTDAALETAAYVAARLPEFGARDDAKAKTFARTFVERAFRRPLTDELKALYVDRQFAGRDAEAAIKRVVLLALKSPRFLYREVDGAPAYDVASRLAFALWDAPPDKELLAAAAAGKLATRGQVVAQAERLVNDPRAKDKVRRFFLQWLKVDPAPDITKTAGKFPGFDAAIASDLRTSLELFLDDVVWNGSSDFRRLLLAEDLYLNGRLAAFYGVDLPANAPFQPVPLDAGKRAGVLTHPYLMATFAYTATTSPIHRGVFLTRNVLGQSLRPPPEAFAPLAPELHPGLTTRERIILQTKANACQSCHDTINPLGFTMEQFDAVGRFRATENGKPVDPTGAYLTRSGATVRFADVRDLAKFLAASEEVHDAFVEQVFHAVVKQPVRAYGREKPAELRAFFAANGYSIKKLMVEVATQAAIEEPRTKNQEPNKK